MKSNPPQLGDLKSKQTYASGDRVIVRVQRPVTKKEAQFIQKHVDSFVGVNVDVLIVDCSSMELDLWVDRKPHSQLAGKSHLKPDKGSASQLEIGCSRIELDVFAHLELRLKSGAEGSRRFIFDRVTSWADPAPVVLLPWRS